jgi:hypothetical protein
MFFYIFIFDEYVRQTTAQDVFRTPFGKIYGSRIFWIPVWRQSEALLEELGN